MNVFGMKRNLFSSAICLIKAKLKILTVSVALLMSAFTGSQHEGASIISAFGYHNCIELKNSDVRVVLEPNLGGRVLAYELHGKNVLYRDPLQDGMVYKPGIRIGDPSGGRSDIGPEMTTPRRPALFLGTWEGKITGIREGQLMSQRDTSTGVQLIRNFRLEEHGSKLIYTQIIRNVSKETKYYSHWARTFVKGGGISLTPLNPRSRFPKGYMIYGPGNVMDFRPAVEQNVRVRNGILEITGAPQRPKFVMDLSEGWLAYITKDDQLFIKKFKVYPDRVYGEMSAANACVWYNKETMCEIEPMGPLETIRPGHEASFTETWYLLDYKYPENLLPDQEQIVNIIKNL
jgi:hypothetical protein